MGILIRTIFKTVLQVLAGAGIAFGIDKFVAPKLPANVYPESIGSVIGINPLRPLRLMWVIVVMCAGVIGLKWLGRKTKIQILK